MALSAVFLEVFIITTVLVVQGSTSNPGREPTTCPNNYEETPYSAAYLRQINPQTKMRKKIIKLSHCFIKYNKEIKNWNMETLFKKCDSSMGHFKRLCAGTCDETEECDMMIVGWTSKD